MSGAELALGIVGAVDVCYKHGKELLETCRAFRNADSRLNEASVRIEACWVRIYQQLYFLRSMEASLDDQHREVHLRILDILLVKLRNADSKLARLYKSHSAGSQDVELKLGLNGAKRAKFALCKDRLSEAVNELEAWRDIFDPTWFLVMKMPLPDLDVQLKAAENMAMRENFEPSSSSAISNARRMRSALRPEDMSSTPASSFLVGRLDDLAPDSVRPVRFSSARIGVRKGKSQPVLLDPLVCTPLVVTNAMIQESWKLSRKLRHADPYESGLLASKGLLREDTEGSFGVPRLAEGISQLSLVFSLPQMNRTVQSVRGRLLGGLSGEYDSLSKRIELARQLAKAVSFVHDYDFVHKNIRPETILVLSTNEGFRESNSNEGEKIEQKQVKETTVLVGFEGFRRVDDITQRLGDDRWEKNIYRHPSRQGRIINVDYDMRHDIYSVGVCLLEIGLWESFVAYDETEQVPLLGPGLDGVDENLLKDPLRVKDHLLYLARGKLKRMVGTRYCKVVETCLTCLDESNLDFGSWQDSEDRDGIMIGAEYIDKVITTLASIVV